MDTASLKAKALAEVAKIEDAAVAEYLKLKTGHYSLTTVIFVAVVALIAGLLI